jgi:hypothetical protein
MSDFLNANHDFHKTIANKNLGIDLEVNDEILSKNRTIECRVSNNK